MIGALENRAEELIHGNRVGGEADLASSRLSARILTIGGFDNVVSISIPYFVMYTMFRTRG